MYKTVKTYITKERLNGDTYEEEVVIIANKLEISPGNYIEVPHPITEFIYKTANCFNSAKKKADTIVQFFNYINGQVDANNSDFKTLEHKGIKGLTWKHAADYLNHCNEDLENSRNTVQSKANVIKELYAFLDRSGVLENETVEYVKTIKNDKVVELVNAPFKHPETYVKFPPKDVDKIPKLKDLSIKHWRKFLEYCEKYEPSIAFGVYLQMMGGLRNGEVVNLDINSLTFDKAFNDLKVHIKDRQDVLFKGRSINPQNNEVKKPRVNQIVLNPFGDLSTFWSKHVIHRKKILDEKKIDTPALFINRDGKAMTGESYKYRFNKVKAEFLNYLKIIDDPKYNDYSTFKWSTHIGRGIFTNFIISQGLCTIQGVFNPRLLADLRGDKNINSAKDYIDTYNLVRVIESSNNIMVDELSKRRMAAAKLVQQRSESLDENDFNRTLKSVKNTLNFEKNKGRYAM